MSGGLPKSRGWSGVGPGGVLNITVRDGSGRVKEVVKSRGLEWVTLTRPDSRKALAT